MILRTKLNLVSNFHNLNLPKFVVKSSIFFLFEKILIHVLFVINHKTGSLGNLHSAASQDRKRRSEIHPIQTRKPRPGRSRSATRESWLFADPWLHLDPSDIVNGIIMEMMMSTHTIRAFFLFSLLNKNLFTSLVSDNPMYTSDLH